MNIEINDDALAAAITKCLQREGSLVLGNASPIATMMAGAITAQASEIEKLVHGIVRSCWTGDEFERRVRSAFRATCIEEAEKIARRTVRGLAMGKEDGA